MESIQHQTVNQKKYKISFAAFEQNYRFVLFYLYFFLFFSQVFLVEKEIVRTTTTRWPLWRIFNYFHRTWCWTWNAMFFFGIVLPWCSPVGLRALLLFEPFMPDLELSQVNGTLFPRKSSLTSTLASRLLSLWRHISKSRTHFETKPDTGNILLSSMYLIVCNETSLCFLYYK